MSKSYKSYLKLLVHACGYEINRIKKNTTVSHALSIKKQKKNIVKMTNIKHF